MVQPQVIQIKSGRAKRYVQKRQAVNERFETRPCSEDYTTQMFTRAREGG